MSSDLLHILASKQSELIRTDQLLHSQQAKQEELTNEMLKFSKDLICELHLLSLVRSKIIRGKNHTVEQLLESQAFKGLKFANLEYCPTFIDPNRLNHYMFFAAYVRRRPHCLARILYDYALSVPQKAGKSAYSLFLSLFQQGWCLEEDNFLFETLKNIANLQYNPSSKANKDTLKVVSKGLKTPLTSVDIAVCAHAPFVSFCTAYFFNAASFSFFQSALQPIIIELHSLSRLYHNRSNFTVNPENGSIGPLLYWQEIVHYTFLLYRQMLKCAELLPPGLFLLMNHLKSLDINLNLFFFESFINRALDNPAVLGLLPWHPGHNDWKPSKDIADVFRTKYCECLLSKSYISLRNLIQNMDEYSEIDLSKFYQVFAEPLQARSLMINETELLSTNPSFPKEILVTGNDLIQLHQAALHISDLSFDPELQKILSRIGEPPKKSKNAQEHFRIVITRQKEMTQAAKSIVSVSLFSSDSKVSSESKKDPFAEQFCDIIVGLPSFERCLEAIRPNSVKEFISQMKIIAPLFLKKASILQGDSVLDYALNYIKDSEGLVERVITVAESKASWGLRATDRTSSLRSQHQNINSSMKIVKEICKNVQSHMLLQAADILVNGDLCQVYREAMLRGDEFITNNKLFNVKALSVINNAKSKLSLVKVNEVKVSQICRILFFKLTDHITFQKYNLSNQTEWKLSIRIAAFLEKNRSDIMNRIEQRSSLEFKTKLHYLSQASALLGHILPNSGVSIVLHYSFEVARIINTLIHNCSELKIDDCLLWVVAKAEAKHVYVIGNFIQHFINEPSLRQLFSEDELSLLDMIPKAGSLLRSQYNDNTQ